MLHDPKLLDVIESLRLRATGPVPSTDALYCSLSEVGARAEVANLLGRQPIPTCHDRSSRGERLPRGGTMSESDRSQPSSSGSFARRARWGFLLLEAVLIVVSILLAFATDAWWEGRQEEARRARTLRPRRRRWTRP